MALAMTLGAVTSTSQVLNFSGYAGGSTIQIQYATRPDFNFCVAPLYVIAAAASHTMQQLNQLTTYYVRAREVTSGGIALSWVSTRGFTTSAGGARDLTVPAVMITPSSIVVPAPVLEWQSVTPQVAGYPVANLGIDAPVAWRSQPTGGVFAF